MKSLSIQTIVIIIIFIFFLVSGCISSNDSQTCNFSQSYKQSINESGIYKNYINVGKERITSIVNNTSSMGQDPERLSQMAHLITQDFTDPNWPYQWNTSFYYYPNSPHSYDYRLINGTENLAPYLDKNLTDLIFVSDKLGHIRQECGSLGYDPYWIAYQKTGDCQELAYFFKKVANESGFETRVVQADKTGLHLWNEVNVNREWKFFDLQRYGEFNGTGDSSRWFGYRSDYANPNVSGFSLTQIIGGGVCVLDDQRNPIQDVTLNYDPNNTTPHGKWC
jgi:hypothetical protein